MTIDSGIGQRKREHIEVAVSGRADFVRTGTMLDEVHLVHDALPELAVGDIDLTTTLVGKVLRGPLMITGMTGGMAEAREINRDLARAAQAAGVAFGVGSQRPMLVHPEAEATYQVRDAAPDVVLIGNLGAVQVAALGAAAVGELARRIGADALAIHLNPAQELIQAGGDRDFCGLIDAIARCVDGAGVPIIVKETGCGLSPGVAARLRAIGVQTVDVAGAGGTSWVAVEAERAQPDSPAARLGRELWDWGVPTAVSTVACASAGLTVIASGGLRSGFDVARAIALGATVGGMAAPVLRAQRAGGEAAAIACVQEVVDALRSVCLLTGCRTPAALRQAPRHLGPALAAYLRDLGLPTAPPQLP